MTDKEALNRLMQYNCNNCKLDHSHSEDCKVCSEAEEIMETLIMDAEKYRWHDLRKDTKDLPEEDTTVLTTFGGMICLNFYNNGNWYASNGTLDDATIEAWCYMKPFEEENNG